MSLLAFVFLMLAIGLLGLSMLVSAIIENILVLVTVAILFIVLCFIVRGLDEFLERTGNPVIVISGLSIILFYIGGVIYISETIELDNCSYYLGFIDADIGVKTLLTIAIVAGISMLVLLIAMYCPVIIQSFLCIGQAVGIVVFCYWLIILCTHSYSDYATDCIMESETLYEYTVNKETQIYYPSYKVENRYPGFFPIKWSTEMFEAGEIVYANSGSVGNGYIRVTNGEIAGYVNISDLSKKSM